MMIAQPNTLAEAVALFEHLAEKARDAAPGALASSRMVIRREAATWERAAAILRGLPVQGQNTLSEKLERATAPLALICAVRGMQRAHAELLSGRADEARYGLGVAVLAAQDALDLLGITGLTEPAPTMSQPICHAIEEHA